MNTSLEIPATRFEHTIRSADQPVLALFYMPSHAESRMPEPWPKVLAEELKGELQVANVNLDESPELARRYSVNQAQKLMLFHHGTPVACLEESMPLPHLKAQLQGLLADYA